MGRFDPPAPSPSTGEEVAAAVRAALDQALAQQRQVLERQHRELVDAVSSAVQSIPPPEPADMTPVVDAIRELVAQDQNISMVSPTISMPETLNVEARESLPVEVRNDIRLDHETIKSLQKMERAIQTTGNQVTARSKVSADMFVKDAANNRINPATEETVTAIQTAVEGPLPAGSNTIGTVLTSSAMSPLNAAGQVFVGGRRVDVAALTSARAIVALRNPSTSGVDINIFALVIYTDVSQWFRYAENPTLNSSTNHGSTAKSLNRDTVGTSPVEMLTDTVAPTVADYWDPETRVTANAPVAIQLPVPVVIPPGKTFAVVGDSSATQSTGINAYFFQTPA